MRRAVSEDAHGGGDESTNRPLPGAAPASTSQSPTETARQADTRRPRGFSPSRGHALSTPITGMRKNHADTSAAGARAGRDRTARRGARRPDDRQAEDQARLAPADRRGGLLARARRRSTSTTPPTAICQPARATGSALPRTLREATTVPMLQARAPPTTTRAAPESVGRPQRPLPDHHAAPSRPTTSPIHWRRPEALTQQQGRQDRDEERVGVGEHRRQPGAGVSDAPEGRPVEEHRLGQGQPADRAPGRSGGGSSARPAPARPGAPAPPTARRAPAAAQRRPGLDQPGRGHVGDPPAEHRGDAEGAARSGDCSPRTVGGADHDGPREHVLDEPPRPSESVFPRAFVRIGTSALTIDAKPRVHGDLGGPSGPRRRCRRR